jgi:hypothetical protein
MNKNTLGLILIHMVTLSHLVKRQVIASMKALMGTSRREVVVGVTCWELKSHISKASMLPTFTYDTKIWGGDFINFHWKVFEKGMKMHMMSRVTVCSSTTYRILMAEFGELHIASYTLKLSTTARPPIPFLASL